MIPLACPACDRQYDVSHLHPGRAVRCTCDAVFLVEHRAPLAVHALACSLCGGPIGADDEGCPFCGARLDADERGTCLCPACFARVPESARHCSACGVAIAPQALTPIPAERDCPRCGGVLRVRSLGERSVIECGVCEGLWIARTTFDAACRDALRSSAPPAGEGADGASSPADEGYISCLACGEPLLRQRFRHAARTSGIVVDACRRHGIWLDAGELARVLSFLREEVVGLHVLGSVGRSEPDETRESAVAERRLPTVVPPPERPCAVAEAVRYLTGLLDDFLG